VVVLPHITEVILVVNYIIRTFCKCHIIYINGFGIRNDERSLNAIFSCYPISSSNRYFGNLHRWEKRMVRQRYCADAVDADGSYCMVVLLCIKPCDDRIVDPPGCRIPGAGIQAGAFCSMFVVPQVG